MRMISPQYDLTLYPCKSVRAAGDKNSSASIERTTENLVGLLSGAGRGNIVSPYSIKLFHTCITQKLAIKKQIQLSSNQPATESGGFGTNIRGVIWEYLASQIRQVPSSEDLPQKYNHDQEQVNVKSEKKKIKEKKRKAIPQLICILSIE